MPKRSELSALYTRVFDAAQGKRVVFRTLDIGSDKVLPYMSHVDEPNPALGWRAIRVGLDKPGVLRMQLQAILRAANGRPVSIMFPFIAQSSEFFQARAEMDKVLDREKKLGHSLPQDLEIGAMLETPSLAYAPRDFFEAVDFISIGGNDLKQFFFAADRENELVRKRYDTLNMAFLDFWNTLWTAAAKPTRACHFVEKTQAAQLEALCLAAIGIETLSMRPASIGPVKHALRTNDLSEVRNIIKTARHIGLDNIRDPMESIYKKVIFVLSFCFKNLLIIQ